MPFHSLPFDPASLAESLLCSVRRAGAAICAVARQGFAVETKTDDSPVTAADRAAEALILADLARLAPAIPIVAEESVAAGHCPQVANAPFWLVDPLDGTKEFIAGNGEYTVNIGLVAAGRPVLGVVYAPVPDLLYWGWEGGNSFCEHDGTRRAIAARSPGKEGLAVLSSRSHVTAAQTDHLASLNVAQTIVIGSSLKFCRLAEGKGDLYPRFGPTHEWDVCAGHAILAAAGGNVLLLDGTPLRYGKPDFLNPDFIATGRRDA